MMSEATTVKLTPVVRFCEFPFGTKDDPPMRGAFQPEPWRGQERVLSYLRSGRILAFPVGADLTDHFDRSIKANVIIDGKVVGGATPMTDGHWFWYAGLIHYVQEYNVQLPPKFVQYAAHNNWQVSFEDTRACQYDFSYFKNSPECANLTDESVEWSAEDKRESV